MNYKDYIVEKINSIGDNQVNYTGKDKMQFVTDEDDKRIANAYACKLFYIGNGDELLNFYTNRLIQGSFKNIGYTRNERNYFWESSAKESNLKRIHSGLPGAIIRVISSAIGTPKIKTAEPYQELWEQIQEENDLKTKWSQQARPLTLAEGTGAWKLNIDTSMSDYPIWEYYTEENIDLITKCGQVVGIIYETYYEYKNSQYMLAETRYKQNGNSYITYDLFEITSNKGQVKPVQLNTIPDTANLQDVCIKGLNKILGIVNKYEYSPLFHPYGESIYAGKLDLFDQLDEAWTVYSETLRASIPIWTCDPDALDTGADGLPTTPNRWNLKFMSNPQLPDGEGNVNNSPISVYAPNVNMAQYVDAINTLVDHILVGKLSPASFGIGVARNDNGLAQREKEKITLMTRDTVANAERRIRKEQCELSLAAYEFMHNQEQGFPIDFMKYDVNVEYDEFANPSFETELDLLGNAYASGIISPDTLINKLYPDWTEEQKAKEKQYLEEHQQQDNFSLGIEEDDATAINKTVQPTVNEEENL